MTVDYSSFRVSPASNKWLFVDLPLTDYQEAWDRQTQLVAARRDQVLDVLGAAAPPIRHGLRPRLPAPASRSPEL